MSNLSILVSKRPSGPQQSRPVIQFWLKNCLQIKKSKNVLEIFSLFRLFQILCNFRIFSSEKGQPKNCSDFKDLGHFVSRIDHIMGKREKTTNLMTFGNYDTVYYARCQSKFCQPAEKYISLKHFQKFAN